MQDLIDVIRAATTSGATAAQKASGVQACRTIIAALDTEPGKPLALPGMPSPSPLAGISIDNVLDLMIARLTTVANTRDAATALPPAPNNVSAVMRQTPGGLRIPTTVVPPRPVARAPRDASKVARAPTKHPNATRKP